MLPMRCTLAFAAILILLGPLAPAALADLIVVDKAGGGDITDLAAAISQAQAGDTLLVRPGDYHGPLNPFGEALVIDKTLTIIGDTGGVISVPTAYVKNLASGEAVIIRNLSFFDGTLAPLHGPAMNVRDNLGTVLFEQCTFTGVLPFTFVPDDKQLALCIDNSRRVAAVRCTFQGGSGPSSNLPFPLTTNPGPGGTAIRLINGTLALYGCTVKGGAGGFDFVLGHGGESGGRGVQATVASKLFVSGGSLEGGDGGDGGTPAQMAQAHGGDAVMLDDFSSLRTVGMAPQGGQGGELTDGSFGPSGQDIVPGLIPAAAYPFSARGLSLPAVTREGETGTLSLTGDPGDILALYFSLDASFLPGAGAVGSFLPAPPLPPPVILGPLPASGALDIAFITPSLGAQTHVGFVMQAVVLGGPLLIDTSPSTLTMLPAGT